MSAARRLVFIAFAALSWSCGGNSLKQAGEACVATSECAQGLLCDRGANVCAKMSTAVDAAEPIDSPADDAWPDIDAPVIDAPAIDAPVIDAPVIDAAEVDAAEVDAAM